MVKRWECELRGAGIIHYPQDFEEITEMAAKGKRDDFFLYKCSDDDLLMKKL